jgi:hypothetical protein
MDTTRQTAEGSTKDPLVIQEAKAPIEKPNLVLQVSTTSTLQQPAQPQDAACDDINDTSSEFSGYSMVTPSATSTSGLEEDKPLSGSQAHEKAGVEGDGVFHAPQLGAGESNIDIDAGNNQQHEKSDAIAKEPSKDDTNVLHTECEPSTQNPKLIGMVVTFEHGVGLDEGQEALQYMAARLGSQVGNVNVLSIEGQGKLGVELTPNIGTQVHSHSDDHCGEHVVTIRCIEEDCKPGDQPQASARIVSTVMLPFSHSTSDPVDTPPIWPDDCSSFHPTELEKARTLRALLGSKTASCSGLTFDKTAQDAAKSLGRMSSDNVPTLSLLIETAKLKIFRELTKHDHVDGCDCLEPTAVAQKTSKIKITSLKGKTAMRLDRESSLIISTSALMLTVISLVLYIVAMRAKAQGHCVGIWLGS